MEMKDIANGEMDDGKSREEGEERGEYKGTPAGVRCMSRPPKDGEVKVYRRPRTEPSGRTAPTNARSSMQRMRVYYNEAMSGYEILEEQCKLRDNREK
jgi:hypothetical protein